MTIIVLTIITFVNQIVFLGFRTWNIRLIAEGRKHMAALSGCFIHVSWLIGVAIGATSTFKIIESFEWQYLPIVIASTLGGVVGTYMGMYKR